MHTCSNDDPYKLRQFLSFKALCSNLFFLFLMHTPHRMTKKPFDNSLFSRDRNTSSHRHHISQRICLSVPFIHFTQIHCVCSKINYFIVMHNYTLLWWLRIQLTVYIEIWKVREVLKIFAWTFCVCTQRANSHILMAVARWHRREGEGWWTVRGEMVTPTRLDMNEWMVGN